MELVKVWKGSQLLIQIKGQLNTITAPQLEPELREDMRDATEVIMDLEQVDYISSTGLRVILSLYEEMRMHGDMKLQHVNSSVRDIMLSAGLDQLLTIE